MSYSLSWNVLPSDVMWEKSYISVYNIFWRCIWSFWNWQMRHEEIKMRTVNVTGSRMVSCKVLQEPWEQFLKSPYKMKDYTVWRIWILYPDFISCDSQGGIHEALPEDPWFSNFITVVGKKQKHSGPKK